jgi:hypothetical protein
MRSTSVTGTVSRHLGFNMKKTSIFLLKLFIPSLVSIIGGVLGLMFLNLIGNVSSSLGIHFIGEFIYFYFGDGSMDAIINWYIYSFFLSSYLTFIILDYFISPKLNKINNIIKIICISIIFIVLSYFLYFLFHSNIENRWDSSNLPYLLILIISNPLILIIISFLFSILQKSQTTTNSQ